MSSTASDKVGGPGVEYPRFEHGEDLLILIGEDSIEFRSKSAGEYVRSDNAVAVEDVI